MIVSGQIEMPPESRIKLEEIIMLYMNDVLLEKGLIVSSAHTTIAENIKTQTKTKLIDILKDS